MSSTCRVSFDDGAGMTHTVSVSASSLYEAAALALAEFKRSGFALAAVGPGTRLKVAVETPATTHELSVAKLQSWPGLERPDATRAGGQGHAAPDPRACLAALASGRTSVMLDRG